MKLINFLTFWKAREITFPLLPKSSDYLKYSLSPSSNSLILAYDRFAEEPILGIQLFKYRGSDEILVKFSVLTLDDSRDALLDVMILKDLLSCYPKVTAPFSLVDTPHNNWLYHLMTTLKDNSSGINAIDYNENLVLPVFNDPDTLSNCAKKLMEVDQITFTQL